MYRLYIVILISSFYSCQESRIAKKDILFIYTDDQAQYSDAFLDTVMPNVQHWIKDKSVIYTNYICSSPYCAPSRATVITGQYPHNTGHHNNSTTYKDFYKKFGDETLGTWMQRAGYHTIFVGKYFNPNFPFNYDKNHIPNGWDNFIGMRGGRYEETPYTTLKYGKGVNRRVPEKVKRSEFEVSSIIDYVKRYKRNNINKPLFIYYAPFEPHTPQIGEVRSTMYDPNSISKIDDQIIANRNLQLKESNGANHVIKNDLMIDRFRALFTLDIELGKLFNYLNDNKSYDDMFVFYTSDNGFILGEHSRYGKELPYSYSVDLPFYVKHPNSEFANSQNSKLVSTVDLASTFMNIGGLSGITTDGENIFGARDRDFVYSEMIKTENESWYMIRSEKESLIEYQEGKYEYYDLYTDPYQLNNRFDPKIHKGLVAILKKGKVCYSDCP